MTDIHAFLGPADSYKAVDGVSSFDTEMYISGMHGGHGGGKTSSFKRCLFLKRIGAPDIADILTASLDARPSPLCYIHLLHGGGAVADVAPDATAFGCRDWDFACVITGIWPRDEDGSETALSAVHWVYRVVNDLLPLSCGVYGADLGPDPRDAALAAKAFGPNRPRLARLKQSLDPQKVLAYACPLPKAPRLIILVTGVHGAGKDFCAGVWVSVFNNHDNAHARAVGISDATKREYAAAVGADLDRLFADRAYKERHRVALTAVFRTQVLERPRLCEEHFLSLLFDNDEDLDVLFITGMRDEAPVAAYSHLMPDSRLIEVCVEASRETLRARRGYHVGGGGGGKEEDDNDNEHHKSNDKSISDYRPTFIFNNNATTTTGENTAVRGFAENHLLPFLHKDLQRLSKMVRSVPNFPRPTIHFRHVLDIAQHPGGLDLCTSLLQTHFNAGDWTKVSAIACCEAGGFVFAAALADRVGVRLALIRGAGKLPPPVVSVSKVASHISSTSTRGSDVERDGHDDDSSFEMGRDVIPRGASVVVVDYVLASGTTLCAVLRLLVEGAGVAVGDICVMVVAEFPAHRGRELLRRSGFGRTFVRSLLVFGGA